MFGLSAVGAGGISAYSSGYLDRAVSARSMEKIDGITPAQTAAVSPVPAVAPVRPGTAQQAMPEQEGSRLPFQREGVDPVEWAVRRRIQYADENVQNGSGDAEEPEGQAVSGARSAQEVMAESECQTCKERKYQDGSDDPGVSFKTPTNIAPEAVASAVRGHEQEHVSREQSKAQREGREVVSQSVTIHTAICPECGKVYVSGGTTRTTTRQERVAQLYQQREEAPSRFQSVA